MLETNNTLASALIGLLEIQRENPQENIHSEELEAALLDFAEANRAFERAMAASRRAQRNIRQRAARNERNADNQSDPRP